MPVARDAGRAVCRKRLWRRMEAERERAEGPRRPGVSGPGALPAAGRCSQRAVRGRVGVRVPLRLSRGYGRRSAGT